MRWECSNATTYYYNACRGVGYGVPWRATCHGAPWRAVARRGARAMATPHLTPPYDALANVLIGSRLTLVHSKRAHWFCEVRMCVTADGQRAGSVRV